MKIFTKILTAGMLGLQRYNPQLMVLIFAQENSVYCKNKHYETQVIHHKTIVEFTLLAVGAISIITIVIVVLCLHLSSGDAQKAAKPGILFYMWWFGCISLFISNC